MADVKFLANIDLNDNQLLNIKLQHLSSDPTGVEGQIYYNTSDNEVKFYNGSAWQAFGTGTATGDITGVTLSGDSGSAADTSANVDLTIAGGTGITTSATGTTVTATIDAAQTGITSVVNSSLEIGRDADNRIKFGTDNQIIFEVGGGDNVIMKASGEIEATSLDISGDVDVDGTLETDALTIGGSAIATVIAGTTVTNATNAAHAYITDNENTNEENQITFIEGAAGGGANRGLEADGDFTYNPSTGTVSATIFKGNIDAVDGDFDGTLEADAITVGGTALNTVIAGVTVTNATTAAVATTVTITDNESTDEDNPIVFVAGGDTDGGNLGLETDGTAHYNPSTGKITATSFAGALTGNVTGNADTATTLATARNINGVSFDGSAAITVTAAGSTLSDTVPVSKGGTNATSFADKSVIVTQDSGTDTLAAKAMTTNGSLLIGGSSGPEVSTLSAGSNITITNSNGGISIAGTANDDVSVANLKTALGDGFASNAANIGDSDDVITIPGALAVTGNLTVTGDTITTTTTTITTQDPIIRLANNNAADVIDVGFYGTYVATVEGASATRYSGVFRDASEDTDSWTFFKNLTDEPTTTINTSHSSYELGDVKVGILKATTLTGALTGNVTGNVSGSAGTVTSIGNLTGDVTSSNRATTISSGAVHHGMLAEDIISGQAALTALAQDDVFMVHDTSASAVKKITYSNLEDDIFGNISGDATVAAGGALTIAADAVTYAKMQNVSATNRILGRDSSGAGVVEEISPSSLRTMINVEDGATADQTKSDIDGLAITTVGTLDTGDATAIVSAASTSAAGKVELATTAEALAGTDTSRAVTAAGLAARSHVATIGDGSDNDIAITHNLGTRNVIVQLFDASSYQTVYAEVVRTDANTVTINTNSGSTIASNDVTVLITKID